MPDGMLQQVFETQMIRKNLVLLLREGRIVENKGNIAPPHWLPITSVGI